MGPKPSQIWAKATSQSTKGAPWSIRLRRALPYRHSESTACQAARIPFVLHLSVSFHLLPCFLGSLLRHFCSIMSMVAFFILICYHTPYASPWILAPVAFYAFDLLVRMFRYRLKDAVLEPLQGQMTLVSVTIVLFEWPLTSLSQSDSSTKLYLWLESRTAHPPSCLLLALRL